MKISMCTISFRHQLRSLQELADWGSEVGFHSIELWATHARSLCGQSKELVQMLRSKGLHVSMLSDYMDFKQSDADFIKQGRKLLELVAQWHCCKLRLFAGNCGSAEMSGEDYLSLVCKLRLLCAAAAKMGIEVIVETHPGTYCDSLATTQQLLNDVAHEYLKVNFDVLHVWEAGDDPVQAFHALRPYIAHVHLKNISSRERLSVFAPHNVYAASGSREGMVPLFEGTVDFSEFFRHCDVSELDASLEWFGDSVMQVLADDCRALLGTGDGFAAPPERLTI